MHARLFPLCFSVALIVSFKKKGRIEGATQILRGPHRLRDNVNSLRSPEEILEVQYMRNYEGYKQVKQEIETD